MKNANNRKQEIIEEFIRDIEVPNASNKLLYRSFKELQPKKKQWIGFVFCIIAGTILSILSAYSEDTVKISSEICNDILTIQVAILGCIFTVYSILLGFLSDSYIKKILKVDLQNRKSFLKTSTSYYESALFMYFTGIVISGLVKIILHCMPYNFVLFSSNYGNEILATILLILYYSFSFRIVLELKSAIYNTIVLFRTSMAYKIIDTVESFEKDK